MKNKKPIFSGADAILHGGDYNPDQWLDCPEVLEEDFRLMKAAGCNTFSLGIFSWTRYEREEGVYDFGWLDRIMDRMAAEGHHILLATPSGAKPAWMSLKYPEIRRVNRDGQREPHKTRHNHCWSSPVYREKVRRLNTALAERYKDHPALALWHVSNEYNGACFCDLCLQAFRSWLQEKYGTLDQLNKRWWTAFWNHTFTAWEEIDPRDPSMDALQTDWSRFHTDQVIDFYRAECEPLNRICPDVPKTTNLMGFFGPLNYWELTRHLDVISDDSYPCLDRNRPDLWKDVADLAMTHSFLRTAARRTGRPWFLMESSPSIVQWKPATLKAPGQHEAEVLHAIANGAEGVLYFQWRKGAGGFEKFHGAVVDHDAREPLRVFQDVAATGKRLAELTEIHGSDVLAEAAVVYDWESRWQLRDSCGTLSHSLTGGKDAGYTPQEHYRELWRRSIATDVISIEQDFSSYRLIIAPQLFMLKPGVAEKIRRFVENGGVFVGTYYTGYVNEDGICWRGGWPGDGLRDVFGVRNEEYDLVPPGEQKEIRFQDGAVGSGTKICELLHAEGAEILAEYAEDFYAGMPVVTRNPFGKGFAFYAATALDQNGIRLFYDRILECAALSPPIPVADKPDPLAVCSRENESGDRYVFLTNWSGVPLTADLGEGRIKTFGGETVLAGKTVLSPFQCVAGKWEKPQ